MRAVAFVGWIGKHGPSGPPRHTNSRKFTMSTFEHGAVWVHGDYIDTTPDEAGNQEVWTGRPFGNSELLSHTNIEAVLKRTDGKFSMVSARSDGITLATDLLSAGPLYYRHYDDTLYFSDHLGLLLQVAAGPVQPNAVGIASLCLAKFQVMEETHVSGFFRLGAGEYLEAEYDSSSRQLSVRKKSYADPAHELFTDSHRIRSYDDYTELLTESMIRENYDSESLLMLSGGNDSQAIALVADRENLNAATYGAKYSGDLYWAKQFARAADLKHHIVPYSNWDYFSEEEVIVDIQGGVQGLNTTQNLVGFNWARDKFSTAIVGFMGDVLGGDPSSDIDLTPEQFYRLKFLQNINNWDVNLRAILPDEIKTIEHWIERQLAKWPDLEFRKKARLQNLTRRQPNWTSTLFSSCDWYLPVSCPFFYRPLVKAMLAMDEEEIRDKKFYTGWIQHQMEQRDIRYKKDGWRYSLSALPSRVLKGTWPPDRVFWDDITRKSAHRLDNHTPCGISVIDKINAASITTNKPNTNNNFPTFSFSLAVQLVFEKYGRA